MYHAVLIHGYSAVDHLGAEVERRLAGQTFLSRRACERAIRAEIKAHRATHIWRGTFARIEPRRSIPIPRSSRAKSTSSGSACYARRAALQSNPQ